MNPAIATILKPRTAERVFRDAFEKLRTPRSNEYKAGVLAALEKRIEGKRIDIPYKVGTAQADAFFSGLDEGHRLAREGNTA